MQTEAQKTDYLQQRISRNEAAQSVDINRWAFEKISPSSEPLNILELCAGTGRQTEYLKKHFPNATISCLDISPDSVKMLEEKFGTDKMKYYNEGLDSFFGRNTERFDLIFCSYGLYYAENIDEVLKKIGTSLNEGGSLIVMGPFGDNNKELFDELEKLGLVIKPFVKFSSSGFMYEKVIAFGLRNCNSIKIDTVVNPTRWNDTESVLTYWKNSTFYDQKLEKDFEKNVSTIIEQNGEFINNKHIMLFQGRI